MLYKDKTYNLVKDLPDEELRALEIFLAGMKAQKMANPTPTQPTQAQAQ